MGFLVDEKGRLDPQFFTGAFLALEVNELARLARTGMDERKPLGGKAPVERGAKQVCQPGGRIDEGHTACGGQQAPRGFKYVGKGRCQFVAGERLLCVGVHPPGAGLSVRRVAERQIEAPGFKYRGGLSKIEPVDLDAIGQMIVDDVFSGQFGQFGLKLDRDNFVFDFAPVSQDERYDATARSQFHNPVFGAHARKAGKQYGVEREAISFPLLADDQLAVKNSVAG